MCEMHGLACSGVSCANEGDFALELKYHFGGLDFLFDDSEVFIHIPSD